MLPLIFAVFVLCFVLERLVPGWRLPRVRTWPARVLAINAVQLGVVVLAGFSWERWLSGASVFHLSDHLGPVVGGLLAYFIATFVFYWWHRVRHESDALWRFFHQIHHSPQRLEVITSFYKHPGEMVVNSIIGSLLVYALLGLSPEAGAIYTLCTALGEFFYHTNVRTPQWVGWFFQRPEMHRIHHQYGRHKNNYGDITWWDMLFGTYENPPRWDGRCGFDADKEEQLGAMLRYRDVHRDPATPPSQSGMQRAEWLLAAGALVLLALAALLPATGLPVGYHDFVDQRAWGALPHAMDVLSNLPFALMGGLGLWALGRLQAGNMASTQRGLAALFCVGLLMTAWCSGFYHLGPNDDGLCLDRLGMSVAFAGLLGLAVADRVSARSGQALAWCIAWLAPVATWIAWHTGNMTPWAVLQGGGLLVLVSLMACKPKPGALGFSVTAVVALYALAKVLEVADAQVFAWTHGLLSGHSAKHLVAAWAAWPVVGTLWSRVRDKPPQANQRTMRA